jgi:NADH-quinone oxidoreductase subunit M
LAAVYLLKMLHETLWGPIRKEENRGLTDLSLREILVMAPLCLLMLAIGLAPSLFLEPSRPALETVLADFHQRTSTPPPSVPTLAALVTVDALEPGEAAAAAQEGRE